jgi:hypothetical protein
MTQPSLLLQWAGQGLGHLKVYAPPQALFQWAGGRLGAKLGQVAFISFPTPPFLIGSFEYPAGQPTIYNCKCQELILSSLESPEAHPQIVFRSASC